MKKLILTALILFSALLIIGTAQAGDNMTGLNMVNTTGTEFNNATPNIFVNVTGNCSYYSVNITMGGTVVVDNDSIANDTVTEFTTSTLTESANYTTNATFWNATCDAVSNTTANVNYYINSRPTISAVVKDKNEVIQGETITWIITWADVNSSGSNNDTVTFYMCKTDAFINGSCTGGQWGNSTGETDGSTIVTYTVDNLDGGIYNNHAFARDDNNYDIASATAGTFLKVGGGAGRAGIAFQPQVIADEELVGEITFNEKVAIAWDNFKVLLSDFWNWITRAS